MTTNSLQRILHESMTLDKKIIFFLDFDGTLVDIQDDPQAVFLLPAMKSLLQQLSCNPYFEVIIVTGRDRKYIGAVFDELPLMLIAEHGACIRRDNQSEWQALIDDHPAWDHSIIQLIQTITDRHASSFYEIKEHSISWHYSACQLSEEGIDEVIVFLKKYIDESAYHIIDGYRHLELRVKGVKKSNAVHHCLADMTHYFPVSIGDDTSDIDMFDAVRAYGGMAISVRQPLDHADEHLMAVEDVYQLLCLCNASIAQLV